MDTHHICVPHGLHLLISYCCRKADPVQGLKLGSCLTLRSGLSEETQVRSLDWEDPLEEEMATHFSVLAWKILWTEEPGSL